LFFSATGALARTTPFPYTTLFRSDEPADEDQGESAARRQHLMQEWKKRRRGTRAKDLRVDELSRDDPCGEDQEEHEPERQDRGQDRKSTRLNSSHLVISYAVFCLK